MAEAPNRTIHAQQTFELADLFAYKFGRFLVGKAPARRLQLMEPDGPSTAGGRQARRPLVLVAVDEADAPSIVCGWVDAPQKTAEIRGYALLSQNHAARFGRTLDLDKEEYERLLAELRGFLAVQRITFEVVSAPAPRASAAAPAPRGKARPWGWILGCTALGMVLGFGVGFLVFGL